MISWRSIYISTHNPDSACSTVAISISIQKHNCAGFLPMISRLVGSNIVDTVWMVSECCCVFLPGMIVKFLCAWRPATPAWAWRMKFSSERRKRRAHRCRSASSNSGSFVLEREQVPGWITDEDARNGGSAGEGAAMACMACEGGCGRRGGGAVSEERKNCGSGERRNCGSEEMRSSVFASRSMAHAAAELGIPLHGARCGWAPWRVWRLTSSSMARDPRPCLSHPQARLLTTPPWRLHLLPVPGPNCGGRRGSGGEVGEDLKLISNFWPY
jgi:hypothetical protein